MVNKYIILIPLIQSLKKLKQRCKILLKSKTNLRLLEFLWENGLIYGFTKIDNSKYITIFLKHNNQGRSLLITKLKKTINKKNLQKEKKWSKNSFFILKTSRGILNAKMSITAKIGGFILYKLF